MNLTRRTLFGRLLVVASVFVVAPAVRVDAAPYVAPPGLDTWSMQGRPSSAGTMTEITLEGLSSSSQYDLQITNQDASRMLAWRLPDDDAITYADGLTPGEREWVDYRFGIGPLTFEAMVADCKAHGCALERWEWRARPRWDYWHDVPGQPDSDGLPVDPDASDHLARVDSWRRSLHAESGG